MTGWHLARVALWPCPALPAYLHPPPRVAPAPVQPGTLGFDPLGLLKDKTADEIFELQTKELNNGEPGLGLPLHADATAARSGLQAHSTIPLLHFN